MNIPKFIVTEENSYRDLVSKKPIHVGCWDLNTLAVLWGYYILRDKDGYMEEKQHEEIKYKTMIST